LRNDIRSPRLYAALLGACVLCQPLAARAQPAPPSVMPRSIPDAEASTILGRDVVDSGGQDVGPLVDVLVDKDGHPIAGVIDVGGFFGVGERRVAVAWPLLHFAHDKGEVSINMDLTFDSAAAAPEFQGPDDTLIVIDRAPP
jgi:hypothetical protein